MATAKKAAAKKPAGPYCYALVDDGAVFYIGKGRDNRVLMHEREAKAGKIGAKCDRIRAIWAEGREVERRILGEYATDAEAFRAEREFIAAHEALTNIMPGGGPLLSPEERTQQTAMSMLERMVSFEQWRPPAWAHNAIDKFMGGREAAYRLIVRDLLQAIMSPEMELVCEAQGGPPRRAAC